MALEDHVRELTAAIHELTNYLYRTAPPPTGQHPDEVTPAAPPPDAAPKKGRKGVKDAGSPAEILEPPAEIKIVDFEEVKRASTTLIGRNRDAFGKLLAQFNVTRASELKPGDRLPFLRAVEKVLAELPQPAA